MPRPAPARAAVAAMARTLLAGQNVVYSGDPLRDLTLAAFLEKFVQKKAKVGAATVAAAAVLPAAAVLAAAGGALQTPLPPFPVWTLPSSSAACTVWMPYLTPWSHLLPSANPLQSAPKGDSAMQPLATQQAAATAAAPHQWAALAGAHAEALALLAGEQPRRVVQSPAHLAALRETRPLHAACLFLCGPQGCARISSAGRSPALAPALLSRGSMLRPALLALSRLAPPQS